LNKIIRIGTRSSKLAIWQASHVARLLEQLGAKTELVTIETIGDKVLNKSIAKIGSKGVFTEELEQLLHEGSVDIAVHSAKDLPSTLPEGLSIIAFSEREDPSDVVVSYNRFLSFEDTSQKLVMGTSSTRRSAFIKHYYPKIRLAEVRGNLQTRMEKMQEGLCDGLILAYAGVHRMEYGQFIISRLPLDVFTPAVGQGSLAIEASDRLPKAVHNLVRKAVNHAESEQRLLCERAFLRHIDGGCSIPSFGLAQLEGQTLQVHAGLISLNGKQLVRETLEGPASDPEALGTRIGELVLAQGGADILSEIRSGG
jgi:hydroxymethylbilane synthase